MTVMVVGSLLLALGCVGILSWLNYQLLQKLESLAKHAVVQASPRPVAEAVAIVKQLDEPVVPLPPVVTPPAKPASEYDVLHGDVQ